MCKKIDILSDKEGDIKNDFKYKKPKATSENPRIENNILEKKRSSLCKYFARIVIISKTIINTAIVHPIILTQSLEFEVSENQICINLIIIPIIIQKIAVDKLILGSLSDESRTPI